MAPTGNGNGSLGKWVIGVVCSSILFLASLAVSNLLGTVGANTTELIANKTEDGQQEIRIYLLEDHYSVIEKRLDSIDDELRELNGRPPRVVTKVVSGGSTSAPTSRRKSKDDVLNSR